jgi:hypothetical protein
MWCLELSGFKHMSLAWWLPEIVREIRFWGASPGCPWGGIILILCLACCLSFVGGLIAGACIFSAGCRRTLLILIRSIVAEFYPTHLHHLDLRQRIAQYRD